MKPKLLCLIENYTFKRFKKDAKAGFLVAIISLPMSMAFAMSCGLGPEQGVYTAIIAGILVGLFGGSRVQIAGPTGAFLMVIQMTLAEYGKMGLAIATIMAGILLILMGFLGVGKLVQYVSSSITLGFTRGIAIIIFTSQIVDFFGLKILNPKINFFDKWASYILAVWTSSPIILLIGILSLVLMFVWPRINKKVPNSFVVLLVISVIVWLLQIDVPTLGEISAVPSLPNLQGVSVSLIAKLAKPAFTIAILATLQALLSAVVTDDIVNDKHDSNAELVAQGMANIACGFVGCMPSTGGVARSIANAKNGGRTPIAAIINGIVLFGMMLFLLPIIKHVPKAVLASIIIYITYNMFNIKDFIQSIQKSKIDFIVMLVTLILTVTVSLVVAIFVGMVLDSTAKLIQKRLRTI